jgi:plasmid stabilization system protein ParE
MYNLYLSPDAELDLKEAIDWYEEQRIGLGQEFLAHIDTALNKLKNNPKLYTLVYKNVRTVLIKKFPYCIFYTLKEEPNSIQIFAIFHTKRNPEIWTNRK